MGIVLEFPRIYTAPVNLEPPLVLPETQTFGALEEDWGWLYDQLSSAPAHAGPDAA